MKQFDLSKISGENPALLYSRGHDYARVSAYGALHGANPGFGITSRLVANPGLRYSVNIGYSALSVGLVNQAIPSESHVCPFDVSDLYAGDE
ncbi:MAG: hypothetical protein FJ161_01415 [Gammaproteobacteria bacterium]|nr:hypothetical protein [Gammaproteobacteria bacterium]